MCHVWEWRINVYRVLVGYSEGKKPLGRPKSRWECVLRRLAGEGVECIQLAQDRGGGGLL
jgi:hypothetical protein